VKFDIVTIFPGMVTAPLAEGVVGRAIERGLVDVGVHDLRDFTTDRHRVVDDMPFGGGPGMVMKPEPFFRAVERIHADRGRPAAIVLTTPDGTKLTHGVAERLRDAGHVAILCGRYEGFDDRIRMGWPWDEISVGDYVLSGGELPALTLVDAIVRLLPGVLGDDQSAHQDSFGQGLEGRLLEYPHYTRPAVFEGMEVPDVLQSGHHGEIEKWRQQQARERTKQRRPDLLD